MEMMTADRLQRIDVTLQRVYGSPRHHNKRDPLEELLFIVLSLQTDEAKYLQTYRSLKTRFATRRALREAAPSEIAESIVAGGLAMRKALQIHACLRIIEERFGRVSLAELRFWENSQIEEFLLSLPGVGKKSARCIMMYSLDRAVFPVDTHTNRVLHRLGISRFAGPIRKFEDKLQEQIPMRLRYTLHVNLLAHGRAICRSAIPRCGECALRDLCPSPVAAPLSAGEAAIVA